jgi:lipoate-protein ligase A
MRWHWHHAFLVCDLAEGMVWPVVGRIQALIQEHGMLLIDTQSVRDPAMNLALEEVLMRRFQGGEPLLFFYVNDPAVVIGRNQVPYVEANMQHVMRWRATVVRRMSGGGAVYHDPGNLNFGLLQGRGADPFPSPGDAVRPVLNSLKALGLPAELNARHDILVDGMKVTGTAQYRAQRKCLTHGTLLVSADLDRLQQVLASDSDVPVCRGRGSVRSPVGNLIRYRPDLTIAAVRAALIQSFAAYHGPVMPVVPDPADWSAARELARSKYRSWEWTVGRAPEFQLRRQARLPWGRSEALMQIRHGRVARIALTLPQGAPAVLSQVAAHLEGRRYHPGVVARAVQAVGLAQGMSEISAPVADWLCSPDRWWQ